LLLTVGTNLRGRCELQPLTAAVPTRFYTEWKQFALRKNIFDVTLGIMIGTALTDITKSLSADILNPLIISSWSGANIEEMFAVLVEGKRKCKSCYKTIEEAQLDGAVTLNYGRFIDTLTSFLFTTMFLFAIYKALISLQKKVREEEALVKKKQAEAKAGNLLKGTVA